MLERLSREIPTLALNAQRAWGAYLVMRGRYGEAIAVLEQLNGSEQRLVVGANRTIALLARAYNLSGNPTRARELCQHAIDGMSEGDHDLVAINQLVFTELALSEARLGDAEAAERRLMALILRHAPQEGPLTLGTLYETLGAVALLRKDLDAASAPFQAMADWYARTRMPSLVAHSELLLASVHPSNHPTAISAQRAVEEDNSETELLSGLASETSTTRP